MCGDHSEEQPCCQPSAYPAPRAVVEPVWVAWPAPRMGCPECCLHRGTGVTDLPAGQVLPCAAFFIDPMRSVSTQYVSFIKNETFNMKT